MLTFLEILCVCVILLSACASEIYKENRCKLNGNLKYLNTVSLLELNLPENLDILLPVSYDDYVIPKVSNINSDTQKIGKKLNICPPVVLSTEITRTSSCLINIEN
ncbi:MAG: outer membrane protein assembly factor BamC [Candidatus Blochmannia vicinus]|nr:MAG: outer membrane protein assembly factor BamC [Candidatus Blochmannia vicinus]